MKNILLNLQMTLYKNNTLNIMLHFKQILKFVGPAFLVSVAYVDPGNFATNISAGSQFNYSLLWVILFSNIMAIFLQTMSAKVGIATGSSIPELCREIFNVKLNILFIIVGEIAAMATNIAEFIGAALGIYLLFHIPLLYSGIIVTIITFLICYLQRYGQKLIEIIISIFIAVICIAYGIEVFLSKPNWVQIGIHTLLPSLPNGEAILIAVSMLGATVMPHVIYLHSNLVKSRARNISLEGKKKHFKLEKFDILLAMNIAFLINLSMIIVSAAVFYKNGVYVDSIEAAKNSLSPLLGSLSSGAFGIALVASGLSSSVVGTMAGENILNGFIKINIPINLTKTITILPAIIIILIGFNPIKALILSQALLSFILPFPIVQMLIIANNKKLMGPFTNNLSTKIIAAVFSSIIIFLNLLLLYIFFCNRL